MKHLTLVNFILLLCISVAAYGQRQITGKVTSVDNNESLIGVAVSVKGTSKGTITDSDGNYSILASPEDTLEFSSLEYENVFKAVGNQSVINVQMTLDVKALSEVVVIGYGTALKKDVTTAIADVNPDDIPKAANNNVNDLLFGKAAGLQTSLQSAQPGGEVDLSIRGRNKNPLIVVDGVIMPKGDLDPGVNFNEINGVQRNGLAGINPNDIESIEILKDASAAIYGIGASDGVILITTKKGSQKKTQVNYSGNYSYVHNVPYIEQLTAKEYMEYYNRFEGDLYNYNNNMDPFGPNPSDYTPTYSQEEINNAGDGTDWVDEILQPGRIVNQNLNFSGGTEKATYYFSANYFDQKGTVKKSGLTTYNVRLNVAYELNKFLTLRTNMNAGNNKYLNNGNGWQTGNAGQNAFRALQAAYTYPATIPVRDADGNYSIYGTTGNPVAQLELDDKTWYNSLLTDINLDINIIPKELKVSLKYGNNSESSYREFYIPSYVFWFDETTARASISEAKRQNHTFEVVASYDKKFDNIRLNIIGGFGEYFAQEKKYGIQAKNMLDAINVTNVGAGTSVPVVNSSLERNRKRSYFSRATVDILDRYIVTGAIRYDGFSYFFPESKYAAFPSVSVGWKINNESFLKGSNVIDLLKLRASYGITGRVENGAIAYGGFEPDDVSIPFDDAAVRYTAYYITSFDNPDLTWEKTVMMNAGFDFAILGNRLTGALDIFRDDVTNLLNEEARTPPLSFLVTEPQNGGHQVRSGWELALEYGVLRTSNLYWLMFGNLSHSKWRWEERFEEDVIFSYEEVTDEVNAIYAFETDGILQLNEEIPAWQPDNAQMPGAPKFVDQNGDNVLDSADVLLYSPRPKLTIGWGSTLKYSNFDLTIQLYGQFGAYKQNQLLGFVSPQDAILANIAGTKDYKDVWSPSNPGGKYPGATYLEGNLAEITTSDYNIMKSDFVRVRNITLGYTITPGRIIQSARIYFDVQNVFTITKYGPGDPEVFERGVKGAPAPYPMARTFSLGLNINF